MNKSQALKEAVKRWGKDAVVMDQRRNASTPEERAAARDERKRLLATLTPEEKKARRHELDDLLYRSLRQRFQVGVHGGFFIGIRGYGDTWEQCFEVADKCGAEQRERRGPEAWRMRIFGEILPFIGWRETFVDSDGEPCCGPSDWYANCLEIEWFGIGTVIYVGKVQPYD